MLALLGVALLLVRRMVRCGKWWQRRARDLADSRIPDAVESRRGGFEPTEPCDFGGFKTPIRRSATPPDIMRRVHGDGPARANVYTNAYTNGSMTHATTNCETRAVTRWFPQRAHRFTPGAPRRPPVTIAAMSGRGGRLPSTSAAPQRFTA